MSSKKLTGNKRIVHDCCVDLYNCVQKWRSVTVNSHSIILSISHLKNVELSADSTVQQEKSIETITDDLKSLVKQLQLKVNILESIVEKIIRTTSKLEAICKLSNSQLSDNSSVNLDISAIPFQSWPISEFSIVSKEIETMFKEELKNKTNICREICILEDKTAVCFFEQCWKYEPNIDKGKLNELLNRTIFELDLQSQLS